MSAKFNLNRPKITDEEIDKQRDFDGLVKKFKEESLKKARGDESWWKNKKITYTAIVAGMTVICTITYVSIQQSRQNKNQKHETLITQNTQSNKQSTSKNFIQAPNKQLSIPFHNYKVDNAKGASIQHSTKSKINVPKNCFVDKNGQNIVGEVTIQYREVNGLHEIIASGIPMAYDSARYHKQLESAGMFEIKGFQNNEPVYIDKEKSIQINYASDNHEDRFNQYYLDTVQRNWQYIKHDDILNVKSDVPIQDLANTSAKKVAQLEQEIEVIIPKKMDNEKQVCAQAIATLPKPNKPNEPVKSKAGRPVFQIEREGQEFPELSVFDNVIFEVGEENKNYTDDLHEITWSDIKITQGPIKGKNYWLNLTYRDKKANLVVYPVFNGTHYKKAMDLYQKKIEEYQFLQEKRITEEKRLVKEMELKQANYIQQQRQLKIELEKERKKMLADSKSKAINELSTTFNTLSNQNKTQRIFQVFNFGIYNSDCAKPIPTDQMAKPIFVSLDTKNPISPDMVFLVNKSQSTVLGLSRDDGFEFGYNVKDEYLICVFNKNEILLCNPDSFKSSINNDKHQFLVSTITAEAKNLNDFKKALSL